MLVVGTQKLRGICWVKFANHLTFLGSVFQTSSHSFSMLGACMANKAQLPVSIHWRLLGGLTKHFEELNVNESGTHGFNFPGNSHVLGNEGGQCLAKCALIYLTPKYTPPFSFPPLKIIQKLSLMSNHGWVLETLETWGGLSSWNAALSYKGHSREAYSTFTPPPMSQPPKDLTWFSSI